MWSGCPWLLAGLSLGTAGKAALQTSRLGGGALRPPKTARPLQSGSLLWLFPHPPQAFSGQVQSPRPPLGTPSPILGSCCENFLTPTSSSFLIFKILVRKTKSETKTVCLHSCYPNPLLRMEGQKMWAWGAPGTISQHLIWIQALAQAPHCSSYRPWDALWALSCSPFPALQERGDPPTLVSETLGGSTGCLPTLCGALWGSFLALAVASFFSPLIHFQVV